MAIIRTRDHIQTYRVWAQRRPPGWIAGRGGRTGTAITRAKAQGVFARLTLKPTDTFLDVGCGDGTLVRLVAGQVQRAIGVMPTQEERDAVANAGESGEFVVGIAQKLPFEDEFADVTVSNAALLLLPSLDELRLALGEIARVTKPGGNVFIGEMPIVPETSDSREPRTVMDWWMSATRQFGWKGALKGLLHIVRCTLGFDDLILHPRNHLALPRQGFIELAGSVGLRCQSASPHSPTRFDYLLCRNQDLLQRS